MHEVQLPGQERFVSDARDLTPDVYRRLVGIRYRKRKDAQEPPVTDESRRRTLEQEIATLEKVDQRPDFLPVGFLADGVRRARAVCRISTPTGRGTGFLIARGVIMTNNHVLENEHTAAASAAEFNFETGASVITVELHPERLFLTDEHLDFTVVACNDARIADIEPIALSRDPATITRPEYVSIIQHPAARMKEVALRNNEVTRVKDTVIHYRTDTLPGSSGSPVFNDSWQLVALHHAGWEEPGQRATNEGIRISSIVAKLEQMGYSGSADPEAFERLRNSFEGTSPYLGFFDGAGIGTDPREVVVNFFKGNRDFADVGFWNIEHFNDGVSDQRVTDVARVLQRMQMDVMGLVEVEGGALDRLVLKLGSLGLAYDHKVVNGPGAQDLAVLYDRNTTTVRLRPDLVDRYKTSRLLLAKTAAGKTAFPRLPLIAECTITEKTGTIPLNFLLIVLHLKAMGDAQSRARRQLAAEVLATIVADMRENEALPVVMGGDYNDLLDGTAMTSLRDSPDLFSMTLDDATGGDSSAISYVGRSHRSLIDHIVVSGDVKAGSIMGDDAAIVRIDRKVRDFTRRVSDHVPIVFRMVYRTSEIEIKSAEALRTTIEPVRVSTDAVGPIKSGKAKINATKI